jgi:hypothetical protein
MELDGTQRNLLGGLGLVLLGAILNGALSPALLPSDLILLALAWRRPR